MAIRYMNPAELFRQMEMELLRQTDSTMGTVFFQPCVDMYETDDALVIKMELAGVKPARLQIELSADDRTMTVAGDRIEPQDEHRDRIRCHHLEIFFGAFQREITLPANVPFNRDDISASYKDGFLVIRLPKKNKVTAEKRTIEITADVEQQG